MGKTKQLRERLRWWVYHPHSELIYLLGGVPNWHLNVLHYRNIESVVADIGDKIRRANS